MQSSVPAHDTGVYCVCNQPLPSTLPWLQAGRGEGLEELKGTVKVSTCRLFCSPQLVMGGETQYLVCIFYRSRMEELSPSCLLRLQDPSQLHCFLHGLGGEFNPGSYISLKDHQCGHAAVKQVEPMTPNFCETSPLIFPIFKLPLNKASNFPHNGKTYANWNFFSFSFHQEKLKTFIASQSK